MVTFEGSQGILFQSSAQCHGWQILTPQSHSAAVKSPGLSASWVGWLQTLSPPPTVGPTPPCLHSHPWAVWTAAWSGTAEADVPCGTCHRQSPAAQMGDCAAHFPTLCRRYIIPAGSVLHSATMTCPLLTGPSWALSGFLRRHGCAT